MRNDCSRICRLCDCLVQQATPDDPVDVDGEVSDRRMKAYQALSVRLQNPPQ